MNPPLKAPLTTEEREALQEVILRAADPLRLAVEQLHDKGQRQYFTSPLATKAIEGGNRSGKTWTACVDFLSDALGLHPAWNEPWQEHWSSWVGWWATVSYKVFGEQTWDHFKRLLLFPGEAIDNLPTRRILAIGWESRNPQQPNYIKLRRPDGKIAEIYFKSKDQGRESFQSAGPNAIHLDEELPTPIYDECMARRPDRGARLTVSALAYNGVQYLKDLEEASEKPDAEVCHVRLDMRDNPSLNQKMVGVLCALYAGNPDLFKLRMQGFAIAREGLVYKDHVFTKEHIMEPCVVPAGWTRYLSADDGWHNMAAGWFAVSPPDETGESEIWLYREYRGQERIISENCAAMKGLSQGEQIRTPIIDRATLGTAGIRNEDGTAARRIDQYNKYTGWSFRPSLQSSVWAGIALVWELLAKRKKDGTPRFRVFRTCENFLRERRGYRSPDVNDAEEQKADKPDNPLKKDDHFMDMWRYFVTANLRYVEGPAMAPAKGTLGAGMVERRRPAGGGRL